MATPHSKARRTCLTATLACALAPAQVLARNKVVRFGLTPVLLDDRVRLLSSWSRQLESAVGHAIEFVPYSAYNQVMDALQSRQLDFAWICGYPYVLHQHELSLVSVPVWRGKPLYQSYLIADAGSGLASVEDLRGRTFAYSDPLSNSGFLYVQHLLRQRGVDPSRYFGRSFFTYSHRQVVEAVSRGLATAGAVDGYVWEVLAELYPQLTAHTRVILRSPYFGFPPIIAPRSTPPALVRRFAAALHDMSSQREGQQVLGELRLDGFAEPTPGLFASIADMARGQKG